MSRHPAKPQVRSIIGGHGRVCTRDRHSYLRCCMSRVQVQPTNLAPPDGCRVRRTDVWSRRGTLQPLHQDNEYGAEGRVAQNAHVSWRTVCPQVRAGNGSLIYRWVSSVGTERFGVDLRCPCIGPIPPCYNPTTHQPPRHTPPTQKKQEGNAPRRTSTATSDYAPPPA